LPDRKYLYRAPKRAGHSRPHGEKPADRCYGARDGGYGRSWRSSPAFKLFSTAFRLGWAYSERLLEGALPSRRSRTYALAIIRARMRKHCSRKCG
jgi:hypothetical protein